MHYIFNEIIYVNAYTHFNYAYILYDLRQVLFVINNLKIGEIAYTHG